MTRWASRVLDPMDDQYLEAVRSQGPVTMIATPRTALHCRSAGSWRRIEDDNGLKDFDQIPLIAGGAGRIESVFVRGEGRIALNSDMFMAADAPLLAFVETADQQRFRLLVADGEVVGLVTLSDLQRLPVYALLFGLVIAVEMLLLERIRASCGASPDSWLQYLDSNQRRKLESHWRSAQRNNVAIDRLSCASFGQELEVAIGLGLFHRNDETHGRLRALKTLRNQVCHASEFAPTPKHALEIPARVRDAKSLATLLQNGLQS